MTKDEVLQKLVDEKFVIKVNDDNYQLSNQLYRVLNAKPREEESEKIVLPNPTELLKKFIKDCQIPFRAKTSMGSFYQLAPETEYSRRYLYNTLNSGKYKYEDMVSAVKSYYNNSSMARVTLTKFFREGVFEQVMEEYSKNPTNIQSVNKVNKVSL